MDNIAIVHQGLKISRTDKHLPATDSEGHF